MSFKRGSISRNLDRLDKSAWTALLYPFLERMEGMSPFCSLSDDLLIRSASSCVGGYLTVAMAYVCFSSTVFLNTSFSSSPVGYTYNFKNCWMLSVFFSIFFAISLMYMASPNALTPGYGFTGSWFISLG